MKTNKTELILFIVFITFIIVGGFYYVYQSSKTDKSPIKYGEWEQNRESYKTEINKIILPPESEAENVQDFSKRGQTIFLTIRYKTQLPENQFVLHIKNELKKENWAYYGKTENGYGFCRGESEAVLLYEGDGGVFAEKGNYFKLMFSSSFDRVHDVSSICRYKIFKKNMKHKIIVLTLFVSVFAAFVVNGQTKGEYENLFSEKDLRSTVKFLSDDSFEGRAPGSRGGEQAAKYIAHRLEFAGIKPGNNGSYFQPVSLVGLKPNPNTVLNVSRDNRNFALNFGTDFVGFTDAQKDDVTVDGDLVFVGYGIDAPEQNWNDYKGDASRYKDKILVMLVNDPPATAKEPNLFGGKALTYYGRWTYKYEEAARKGAKGVILIHTDSSAGYGWNVVETSFGGTERFDIARTADDKTPFLQFKAWMRDSAAEKFIDNLSSLMKKAESRDFQPVDLKAKININLKAELQRVDSQNVVGMWEGVDAKMKDEYVIYTAHWDHIGVGKPDAKGDTIYNGALDNASGVAQIIAIAEAITKLPKAQQPKRSQVFLFTTAEEQGLLGSEYYAKNPVFPLDKTAANLNIDGGNFFGKTKDYGALGADRSSLGDLVNDELTKRNMTFAPDGDPGKGFFFRSDHFPFAKVGVPALSIRGGNNYIGSGREAAEKFSKDYSQNRYHQPSDEFSEEWVYDGMVQMLEVSLAIGLRASNIEKLPAFNVGDEFAKAQPNRK